MLKGLVGIPMPQIPLDAVEPLQGGLSQFVLLFFIVERLRQAFGDLMEDRQAHRDMEPIQQVFGFWVEVELQVAHRLTAIGEEGDLLVGLHALAFEHLEQPPFGFVIIGLDKSKALADAFLWNRWVLGINGTENRVTVMLRAAS